MPKHDMEDIFRKKLEDFEPQHGDRWEEIAAALPQGKKRRAGFWLWFGTGMALLIGAFTVIMYPFGSEQVLPLVSNKEIPSIPPASAETPEGEPTKVIPLAPSKGGDDPAHYEGGNSGNPEAITKTEMGEPTQILPLTPSKGVYDPAPSERGNDPVPTYKGESDPVPSKEPAPSEGGNATSLQIPPTTLPPYPPQPEPQPEFFSINENGDTIRVRKTSPIVQNDSAYKKLTDEFPSALGKWSMGFGMGVYSSRFDQRMPQNQGNTAIEQQGMVQRNQELRQKIEKAGIAFSQSIWIQFQPHRNWSFSTGISMVQSTQKLEFNLKSKVPDSVRGPQDFPEVGSTARGSEYFNPNDSILPGSGYTATNKYLGREIPFFLNYHLPINPKLALQFSVGATYRWVTSASVFFPDIDNVGIIYLNGPAYYPGLRGTWNIQGGIALNYQLNDYFSLNMMPSVQYALQSNIGHEHYVQQYQRQWGLQLRLTRKLGF